MKKTDFPEIWGKAKSGINDVVNKAKGMAESLVKIVPEKVIKQPKTEKKEEKKLKLDKKEKLSKKECEPQIKLDDALHKAIDQYNDAYTTMNDNGTTLYWERIRAVDMIVHVENLVNSIANSPKKFDTEITEIQTHRESFVNACEFAKAKIDVAKRSALGAGVGVAAGTAIVSVAPTATMWVATTFGTASTGTAISALSGAAAKNAALAWLGGGSLAAGGGGMAAGHAFLALAGPIGWGIAGVTLLSSIVLFSLNKLQLGKKKKEEIESVKNNTATAQKVAAQIQELLVEITGLRDNLCQQYNNCLVDYGRDFMSIPREQQTQLGKLVNITKALAASLGKNIQ